MNIKTLQLLLSTGNKLMIITIDGPVASGKSTVAKKLAQELNIYYLYTGLLYRAVAYALIEQGCSVQQFEDDAQEVTPLQIKQIVESLVYTYEDGAPIVTLDGHDVTQHLPESYLDQPASVISTYSMVRTALLDTQRDIGKQFDIIADGRDCGSVVFPDADHKFVLTADVDVRARRYMNDPKRSSTRISLSQARETIKERDYRDINREVAPFIIPPDATVIDNSKMDLQETLQMFHEKINRS